MPGANLVNPGCPAQAGRLRYRPASRHPLNGPGGLIYEPGSTALGRVQPHPGPSYYKHLLGFNIQGRLSGIGTVRSVEVVGVLRLRQLPMQSDIVSHRLIPSPLSVSMRRQKRHIFVTMTRNSLWHNARRGFDSPHRVHRAGIFTLDQRAKTISKVLSSGQPGAPGWARTEGIGNRFRYCLGRVDH